MASAPSGRRMPARRPLGLGPATVSPPAWRASPSAVPTCARSTSARSQEPPCPPSARPCPASPYATGADMAIATTDPTTGQLVRRFDAMTPDQIEAALAASATAFEQLRHTSFAQRAEWMNAAADILDAEADQVAATMSTEMGKTLASAKAEVAKCAKGCRHYASHAERYLADEPADPAAVGATTAYARYFPLGPVLAVMPWNFPLWQAIRFAAPALMAGNVGLLKHASNVPQTALYMQDLFRRAGFPADVFTTLLVGSDQVERILRDDRVKAATLTGSESAGRSVASIAGRELKKMVLELGGTDPFVV